MRPFLLPEKHSQFIEKRREFIQFYTIVQEFEVGVFNPLPGRSVASTPSRRSAFAAPSGFISIRTSLLAGDSRPRGRKPDDAKCGEMRAQSRAGRSTATDEGAIAVRRLREDEKMRRRKEGHPRSQKRGSRFSRQGRPDPSRRGAGTRTHARDARRAPPRIRRARSCAGDGVLRGPSRPGKEGLRILRESFRKTKTKRRTIPRLVADSFNPLSPCCPHTRPTPDPENKPSYRNPLRSAVPNCVLQEKTIQAKNFTLPVK